MRWVRKQIQCSLSSADVSFHLLLGEFLSSNARSVVPHTLPSENFSNSAAVVHAVVDLSLTGQRSSAMDMLTQQLQHPDAAETLLNIGKALRERARYNEALQHQAQAFTIDKEALGESHPALSKSLTSLGLTLSALGRHEESLQHLQRALTMTRQVQGELHSCTAVDLNNLSMTLLDLGRHEEALRYQLQALAVRQAVHGKTHPSTATSLNNLGLILCDQGRYQEALQHHQQALAICQTALDESDQHTTASLNNVGLTLHAMGRHEEALQYAQQALANWKSNLGDLHPDVAIALLNEGGMLCELGRHEEGLQRVQQALAICKTTLGESHPTTANSLNNVGGILHKLGRHEEALQHTQHALAIFRSSLGEMHMKTASVLMNVCQILSALGRHEDALQHVQQLVTCTPVLATRLSTATWLNDVGAALRDQGRPELALQHHLLAFAIRKESLGASHTDTEDSLRRAALTMCDLGRGEEAFWLVLQERADPQAQSEVATPQAQSRMRYAIVPTIDIKFAIRLVMFAALRHHIHTTQCSLHQHWMMRCRLPQNHWSDDEAADGNDDKDGQAASVAQRQPSEEGVSPPHAPTQGRQARRSQQVPQWLQRLLPAACFPGGNRRVAKT